MPTTNPTPNAFGNLQYFAGTSSLVLVNSGNYPAFPQASLQTWQWSAGNWSLTNTGIANNPTARTDMSMASDGTNMILFGGRGLPATGFMNDTWILNSSSVWSNTISNDGYDGGLTIRANPYMATMTGGIVLFGGKDMHAMLQDTWLWTHGSQAWTLQTPTNSPSIRVGSACASNGTNNMVLFGGANESFMLNDSWSYNGTNWSQLTTSAQPSVRKDAVMAWYPTGSYFLLFGGTDTAGNVLHDTWTFDGTSTWTRLAPANNPSGRVGAMMAYDTTSSQMILFGGKNNSNLLNDTWQWNGTTWLQR